MAESLSKDLAHGLEVASEDPARVRVVRYEDLVSAPVETLAGIHAGFGIPFSPDLERAARAWLAANPQGRHGTHTYDLATYGLDEETVKRLFATPRKSSDGSAEELVSFFRGPESERARRVIPFHGSSRARREPIVLCSRIRRADPGQRARSHASGTATGAPGRADRIRGTAVWA